MLRVQKLLKNVVKAARFLKVPNYSEKFRKLPKSSEKFRKLAKSSENFRKVPKTSEKFRKVPKKIRKNSEFGLFGEMVNVPYFLHLEMEYFGGCDLRQATVEGFFKYKQHLDLGVHDL